MMKRRAVSRRMEKGYLIRAIIADLIFVLVIAAFIIVVLLVLSNVYGNPHTLRTDQDEIQTQANDRGGDGYVTQTIFNGIMLDQAAMDPRYAGVLGYLWACHS